MNTNRGIETAKTKLQTPKKAQVRSSKSRPALRAWKLEFGASLMFGACDLELVWCLEFGVWSFDWLPGLLLFPSLSPLLRRWEREKIVNRSFILRTAQYLFIHLVRPR